jgi:hypothetical protein
MPGSPTAHEQLGVPRTARPIPRRCSVQYTVECCGPEGQGPRESGPGASGRTPAAANHRKGERRSAILLSGLYCPARSDDCRQYPSQKNTQCMVRSHNMDALTHVFGGDHLDPPLFLSEQSDNHVAVFSQRLPPPPGISRRPPLEVTPIPS